MAWADNAGNEDGFKIERSTNGTNFSQIAIVGANVTTHSNTGLSASTTYYYRVRGYNGAGDSSYSNTASATTQASSGSTMHVADIQVDRIAAGGGVSKATAIVTIVDNNGVPVTNATVTINFTEAIVETKSGVTGSNGMVTITTNVSAANPAKTTGCVGNVTHVSLTYNAAANVKTCDKSY